ncbi:MAG TPA: hypothetical protein VNZ57_07460 [Longimicrobiales bacterium]|nr:hypothetical protein [Longimicrobiales bacterium]
MKDISIEPFGTKPGVSEGRNLIPWTSPRVDVLPPLVDLTLVTLDLDENQAQGGGIQGGESIFSSPDT